MAVGSIVARILTQYSDKGSKAASKDIAKLGKSFDKFASRSAKAFGLAAAAAAGFAIKIGKDAVEAAIADQKSQALLASSLRNTTGATNEAITGVESYITGLQKQFSVVDDDLRPAMARLSAATGSITVAQNLMDTALNVSAASGTDLETAVNAIIKATTGQFKALRTLVPGLSAATVKSKNFGKALEEVNKQTKGAAATRAGTLEYRLAGLKIAFGEILETLGYALLPVMEKFASILSTRILPQVEAWISANKDRLAASFQVAADFAVKLLEVAIKFGDWVVNNTTTVKVLAGIIAGMFVVSSLATFIAALGTISAALVALRTLAASTGIALAFASGGTSAIAGAAAAVGITAAIYGASKAGYYDGGSSTATSTYKPVTNGYLGSMPVGSAVATTNPVLSGPNNDFANYLKNLQKTLDNTGKTTKKLVTEEQKRLNLKLKELGIVTTEQQEAISQSAAIRNLERQKRLSGSSTIAIGASGALDYIKNPTVVINTPAVVGSTEDLVKTVEEGISVTRRRGGYAGRYNMMNEIV